MAEGRSVSMAEGRSVNDGDPKAGPQGIERDLELVSTSLDGLRALAEDEEHSDSRVYDFSIRWGVMLSGRLKRLEHYHRSGELTQAQERRYGKLRRELEEAAPLAGRLGIARPDDLER